MASITVTDLAAEKGRDLIRSQASGMTDPGLRVTVKGGGCSGLMTRMEFEDGPGEDDHVIEHGGFRVYVDKKSLFFLSGAVLDYRDGLTGAGFKFENPNASSTCGCGESFAV